MKARASVVARIADVLASPTDSRHVPAPCVMVIFGAGGDLTRRKLVPALYHLHCDGLLPDGFQVIGAAREPNDDASFRDGMRESIRRLRPDMPSDGPAWDGFARRLSYIHGELDDDATYRAVAERLAVTPAEGRLCYLAIPPSLYSSVIRKLAATGVAPRVHDASTRPWVRVVIEKPFGRDPASARALNLEVRRAFAEHQVYRIDHYLGKETVQNLLVLRFANSIFEPVWNRHHVHHVQITAAESVGVETRGRYYEEAGVVRDMFQNHLLQLLTLAAMEPPYAFTADAVRDEKVKVLHAIRPPALDDVRGMAVRGQYGPGSVDGRAVVGYRQEPNVAPDSGSPTYGAVRFMVDNWRWRDVPFFLRSGKRLPHRASEIAIQFRRPPHLLFAAGNGEGIEPNVLAVRIQPNEGISLRFEVKVPGIAVRPVPVDMQFGYEDAFGTEQHDAYETLLLDCMLGDATLFARADEVDTAWQVVNPLLEAWEGAPRTDFPNYAAGSWGPAAADALIAAAGARWREP